MEDIGSKFIKADKLIEEFFGKDDKFERRFVSLVEDMDNFLNATGLQEKATVNQMLVGYALVNYFEDITRLKEFHHVGHVNNIKIVAYTSYWLLRAKPIQIKEVDKKLAYVNERFVLSYILSFLERSNCGKILERENAGLTAFTETLFYYLKYRSLSAQVLEMVIISFFAGQVYQEIDADISAELGKLDMFNEDT